MSEQQPHILVAEDDKSVRLVVQQALARQGYAVQSSGNAAGLWKLIESGKGDVLITDVALPDGDALDLLPRIMERRPDMPVIVMSARSTLLTAVKAQETGVFEYLPKPFELRALIEVTARAVTSIGTHARTPAPKGQGEEAGPLVGRSRPMQEIFKAMARVVRTDLTVLVTGESGTGKELVARALHDLAMKRARLWGQTAASRAALNRPRGAACFLTRWAICRPRHRRGCCVSCRMVNICLSGRTGRFGPMFALSPRPIMICSI
jgi:two-component system nitrogen regulation response regulator GlnG